MVVTQTQDCSTYVSRTLLGIAPLIPLKLQGPWEEPDQEPIDQYQFLNFFERYTSSDSHLPRLLSRFYLQ